VDERVVAICEAVISRSSIAERLKAVCKSLVPQGLAVESQDYCHNMILHEITLLFEEDLVLTMIQGQDIVRFPEKKNMELLGEKTYNIFAKQVIQFCVVQILNGAVKFREEVKSKSIS